MLHVVWEFHVKAERENDFARHYGPYGKWAMLFRKSPFYDRTILTRDSETPTRYLLTDIWVDVASFESFKRDFREAYDTLDEECEQFTQKETCIGFFEQIEDRKPKLFAGDDEESTPTSNK